RAVPARVPRHARHLDDAGRVRERGGVRTDGPGRNRRMTDTRHDASQWWIAAVGDLLIWARLCVLPAGTAEVLDNDGRIHPYDSEDSARAALLDAEFRAFDGLDGNDAERMGFDLGE